MYGIQDLERIIYSHYIRKANAERNLKTYLNSFIHPDFTEKINYNSIFNPLATQADKSVNDFDKSSFLEDIVDKFIEKELGKGLRTTIRARIRNKFKLSPEEAESASKGKLDDKDVYNKILKEYSPMVYSFVQKSLNNFTKEWIRKHQETSAITKDTPEPSVQPEHEIEEEIRNKHQWEEGLIKDILHLINQKTEDKNKRSIYKYILKEYFLAKDPKTLKQMADVLKISIVSVFDWRNKLAHMLSDFLKAQGLGGKFLEEGGLVRKDVETPDYEEYLKDHNNSKNFKEFLEDKFDIRLNDLSKEVFYLLAEGESKSSVLSETKIESKGFDYLKGKFNKWYKEWYEEKVEEIRKASYIKEAFMQFKAEKTVVIPKKEKEDNNNGVIIKAHENMVDRIIDKNLIIATIYFSSQYDNVDIIGGKKDPSKDPTHFKYEHYEAYVYEERKFIKDTRSVEYEYKQRLNDDGTFIGHGESELKLDDSSFTDNGLKKNLDSYVQKTMIPEGVIPHGKFPVIYINTHSNKKYNGIRNFYESYRGILIEDSKHKERSKKWHEIQDKKRMPTMPITDMERAEETLQVLKLDLKDEEKKSPKNVDVIDKLKAEIEEMDKFIKTRGKDFDDIKEIMELEKKILALKDTEKNSSLVFSAVFPPPKSESVKNLIALLESYHVDKPKPSGWLEVSDLIALSKILKTKSEAALQVKIKNIKSQKGKKEDKNRDIKEAEMEQRKDLAKAQEYFKSFPEDLKKRGKEFENTHPADYLDLSERKNMTWVNNESNVDETLSKINRVFLEESKVEKPHKKQVMRMLERKKFESLENFLETSLSGLDKIAQKFETASLEEEKLKPEVKGLLEKHIDNSHKELERLQNTLKEFVKEVDDKDISDREIEDIREKSLGLSKDINKMRSTIRESERVPALMIAKSLQDDLAYFSALYSLLSSILWFGEKPLVKADEFTQEDFSNLDQLRSKIVGVINRLSAYHISARDEIKSGLSEARGLLKKFVEKYRYYKNSSEEFNYKEAFPYSLVAEDKKDWETARINYIFPSDELHHAKQMIESFKLHILLFQFVERAQKEYDDITKNFVRAYEDFPYDKIKAIAKKENISEKDASIKLRKIKESLAKFALSEFILKWKEIKEKKGEKIERSELGNKHPNEYEVMGEFVERHLPKLFEQTPPEEDLKEAPRGIPTPKDIREEIEKKFNMITPKEMEEKYEPEGDLFKDYSGAGGGSGGKSKNRQKAIKAPPPSATFEELKEHILRSFNKDPEDIVLLVISYYIVKVRNKLKTAKEGEFIDPGDVIDGIVSLLKNFQYLLVSFKVGPSRSAIKHPAPGAPQFTGKPELIIESYKDAEKLFDKYMGIYKTINHYIAPDEVGMPPKDLSVIRSKYGLGKRYLPAGLLDWYEVFKKEEEEGKSKKANMIYRLINSFSCNDLNNIDAMTEEDIL